MSCRSAIYAVNTATATIAEGGIYPPASIIRRYGQACQMAGNGITLDGCGYYDTAVSATVSGTIAGAVTLAVYQDGVAIPGMTATQTVKAVGDAVTLNVSGIVRVVPSRSQSMLTVVISGQSVTGSNLAADVTKQ